MVSVDGWRLPGMRAADGAGRPYRLRAGLAGWGRVAVVLAAALVTGCGSVHGPGGATGARATGVAASAAGRTPVGGSRAEAIALARRMLARMVLPAGAQTVHLRSLPQPFQHPQAYPGSANEVDLYQMFGLRKPLPAVAGFLATHPPAGMRVTGTGQSGGGAYQSVSYAPRALPRGIYQAGVTVEVMVSAGGGSLLRADAQAIWDPPRAAAEYLNPANFRVVTVKASLLNPSPHAITRTFTSPTVIASLTGRLDSLPAAPPLVVPCPMVAVTYQVTFAASATSPPRAVATSGGCLTDQLSVAGNAQPPLLDPGAKLARLAQRLLRQDRFVPPTG